MSARYYDSNGREFRIYAYEPHCEKGIDSQMDDPQQAIRNLARSYAREENSDNSKVNLEHIRRALNERPNLAAAYELSVKGSRGLRMTSASLQLSEMAKAYAKTNEVDLRTAYNCVMEENPRLRDAWAWGK